MQNNSYGSVWQQASANMADLLASDQPDGVRLRRILELGYFSQFTSYPSHEFNNAIASWLQQHLEDRYNLEISDLPDDLVELDIVPAATIVRRGNRNLSPDLLRYVAYAMQLGEVSSTRDESRFDILEVGSGYGGLARTLKCFHPGAHFWLTDIPESLRCAEIYLREAFPDATITWQKVGAGDLTVEADFCLVPVADAPHVLAGRRFDLAINAWSFGEMPNVFIDAWLRIVQQDCYVSRLFSINSFMAPVTPASVARTELGDWLFGLDDHWDIEHFEIDPLVHRCPLMRNFPKGIGLLARRVTDKDVLAQMQQNAAREAKAVMQEDWVGIALDDRTTSSPGRPERVLELTDAAIDINAISSRRLTTLTDYIGHFNIESGIDGALFRLWNDYRMNRSERSGALLVAYLAMVSKTDLEHRCTKEELLLLKRLPELPLHQDYATFGASVQRGKISDNGAWLSDQDACDRALEHKKDGEFDAAETLWIKVAAAYPAHGDCWFQLALLRELRSDWPWAAVFAAHSVRLGCDYYLEGAARMKAAFFSTYQVKERKEKKLLSFFTGWPTSQSLVPGHAGQNNQAAEDTLAPEYCRQYFEADSKEAISQLSLWEYKNQNVTLGQALERALDIYPFITQ
jgi:hypothetical protein